MGEMPCHRVVVVARPVPRRWWCHRLGRRWRRLGGGRRGLRGGCRGPLARVAHRRGLPATGGLGGAGSRCFGRRLRCRDRTVTRIDGCRSGDFGAVGRHRGRRGVPGCCRRGRPGNGVVGGRLTRRRGFDGFPTRTAGRLGGAAVRRRGWCSAAHRGRGGAAGDHGGRVGCCCPAGVGAHFGAAQQIRHAGPAFRHVPAATEEVAPHAAGHQGADRGGAGGRQEPAPSGLVQVRVRLAGLRACLGGRSPGGDRGDQAQHPPQRPGACQHRQCRRQCRHTGGGGGVDGRREAADRSEGGVDDDYHPAVPPGHDAGEHTQGKRRGQHAVEQKWFLCRAEGVDTPPDDRTGHEPAVHDGVGNAQYQRRCPVGDAGDQLADRDCGSGAQQAGQGCPGNGGTPAGLQAGQTGDHASRAARRSGGFMIVGGTGDMVPPLTFLSMFVS